MAVTMKKLKRALVFCLLLICRESVSEEASSTWEDAIGDNNGTTMEGLLQDDHNNTVSSESSTVNGDATSPLEEFKYQKDLNKTLKYVEDLTKNLYEWKMKNFSDVAGMLLHTSDNILEEELKKQTGTDRTKTLSQREVMQYEKSKTVMTRLFLPPDLTVLEDAIEALQDAVCRDHVLLTLHALNKREKWAMQMLDASAKFPDGVLAGSLYQFGNYDECVGISYEDLGPGSPGIKGQYCLADVHSNDDVPPNVQHKNIQRNILNSTLHWAICLPHSCKPKEASLILDFILNGAIGNPNAVTTEIKDNMCTFKHPVALTELDIAYGYVIVIFLSIITLATLFHIFIHYAGKESKIGTGTTSEIVLSFSVIRNVSKMLQVGKNDLNLNCICGIKFFSMLFIIAGHTLVFILGGPVTNDEFFKQAVRKVENSIFLNNPLLVDTFLLVSGFLMCRLVLVELDKRKGKVNFIVLYVFRYIRLTPAYLVVIGLYCTWLIRLDEGPLWNARIAAERDRCLNSWWANLLYINNYVNINNLCMFQSWYLAVDTQLFMLAPLIVYPLWKWTKYGIAILAACTFATVIVPFILTYKDSLDPTLLLFIPEIADISLNDYFVNVYMKTHIRASSYVFGIIFGYLVHLIHTKDYKLSKGLVYFGWIFSTACSLASMCTVIVFYEPEYSYNPLEAAAYSAFHRISWCLGIGWILLACITDNAGPVQRFLSWKVWIPLSRLTYCAYLVNGLVELQSAATIRQPRYMSVYDLSGYVFSHILWTFSLAFILCVMFESPIHGFEKILLRKEAKHRNTQPA